MTPDTRGPDLLPGENCESDAPASRKGEKGDKPEATMSAGRRNITEEDYHRLHPKLFARFRALGAFPEEARDLTQETFLRAHRGLGAFEGRSHLDTWAMSIAKKVWLQHSRDQRRQKRSAEEVSLDPIQEAAGQLDAKPGVEDEVVTRDLIARVSRTIRGLPELMRQALTLYVEGYPYRKIAVLLGVSENRVSSLIHQARKKLRREIRERTVDPVP